MIKVAECGSCGEVKPLPDNSAVCADCVRPVRFGGYQRGICSVPGCRDKVLQSFGVEVAIEDGDTVNDPEDAAMVASAVDTIIRGIILIEGGLCEKCLSDRFDSITERKQASPSGFDLVYQDIRARKVKQRDEQFTEEWA